MSGNRAVIRAGGTAEVIRFREVAATDAGTHLLSSLLRGRRGTEVHVSLHEPGEMFVMLGARRLAEIMWAMSGADAIDAFRQILHAIAKRHGSEAAADVGDCVTAGLHCLAQRATVH